MSSIFSRQAAAVATICRQLDGLPLAVELAASWVRVLPCEQIARQIEQQGELLATHLHDLPERHRSLRALFDQSWRLLSDDERDLLMRLSVFRGDFALEYAAAVVRSPRGGLGAEQEDPDRSTLSADLIARVAALVEKSLVNLSERGRYHLHELTRRYVAEHLAAYGEADAVRRRHFEVYLALAETAATHFSDSSAAHWYRQLDDEHANLRVAWDWALQQAAPTTVYRLTIPLAWYWYRRGMWEEGATRLQQALDGTEGDESPQRTLIMSICGTLLARSGRSYEALPYLVDSYRLAKEGRDDFVLGYTAMNMSQAAREPEQRRRFCTEAIMLFRTVQNQAMLATALWLWGDELRTQGELELARVAYAESLQLFRSLGNQDHIVYPLGNLGRLALLNGDVAAARRSFAECVDLSRLAGNRVSLVDWLTRLGNVTCYQGDHATARAALQEALRLAQELAHNDIIPNILAWLALVAVREGELNQAGTYLQQSLDMYAGYGATGTDEQGRPADYYDRPDVLDVFIAAAHLYAARAEATRAVVMLSFAEKLQSEGHYHLDPPLQALTDDLRTAVRSALSDADFRRYWNQGQSISIAELVRA